MIVLLLTLLSSPGQEPATREDASGFVFTRPKGWTKTDDPKTGMTHLKPPDLGPGELCNLILYPTAKNFAGTADDLHKAILDSVTMGLTAEGKPETGKTGLFQWTRAKMTSVTGEAAWIAVYTAKSGETIGGAVLAAGSATLFESNGKIVDRMLEGTRFVGDEAPGVPGAPGAAAADGQAIHGLVIPLPPGWTRKEQAGGLIALSPPPPRSALEPVWDYVLYVLPSQPLDGTLWKTHRAIFQEAIKSSQLKNPVPPIHDADAPGPFIRSASAGHDAAGGVRSIAMYSALSDGKVECILVHNHSPAVSEGYRHDAFRIKSVP